MKSKLFVLIGISFLLAALHIPGNIYIEPLRAENTITPKIGTSIELTQANESPAKADVPQHLRALDRQKVTEAVPLLEELWGKQYEDYFGTNFSDQTVTIKKIADGLGEIATQTGKKPALIYMVPRSQQLELVLITPGDKPIHKRVEQANSETLLRQVQELTLAIASPIAKNNNKYLPIAQQLYQWMVLPLEKDLQAQSIDTLLFCMGPGLRTMPLAALHDGQKFLVEKYSFARVPAFKLTDTVYTDLRKSPVLAMGASEFKEQESLPAVPVELAAIAQDLSRGKFFLNEEFTLANLRSQRSSTPFQIIHLATHADFQSGSPSNSYVQFWDTKLNLVQMRQLHWNDPPVSLLVLSACRTAVGDKDAELGFAGLAVQANVKSVVASLWNVSDEGTLGLMREFYQQLQTAPIKAEALRQAQIAMITGQVRLEDGKLLGSSGSLSLPRSLALLKNQKLSHPYYWAAFTVVGNPW